MAIPFLSPIDLNQNQILRAVLERLAVAPLNPVEGRVYYNTALRSINLFDGTEWIELGTGDINTIEGTSPIGVSVVGGTATISMIPASLTENGYMSSVQYALIAGATPTNTPDSVVLRDAFGDFSARVITADLTGTSSNSSALDGNSAAYLLDRTNHTGTQSSSTISDFDSSVRTSALNQMAVPTAALDFNGQAINNLGAPVSPNDAVRLTDLSTITVGDADLLDGNHGSYYLDRANHTGTQLASTISDFNTQVILNSLSDMAVPTSSLSMNSQLIQNLAGPVSGSDAANKQYVDDLTSALKEGFDYKDSVRTASEDGENIDISSPPGVIGGVTLNVDDRVLLTSQIIPAQNGIYQYFGIATPMRRASDANENKDVTTGLFTYVAEGTYGGSQWVLGTPDPITLDTTALDFFQYNGAALINAGEGLSKTGSTLDVQVGNLIQIDSSDRVALDGPDFDAGEEEYAITAMNHGEPAYGKINLESNLVEGILPIEKGGTGGDNVVDVQINLGIVVETTFNITGDSTTTVFYANHGGHIGAFPTFEIYEDFGEFRKVNVEVSSNGDDALIITFGAPPIVGENYLVVMHSTRVIPQPAG